MREGQTLLNLVGSLDQTPEDLSEVTSLLHGDDAEVIILVAPDEEGLVVVVEDTTSRGPVAAGVGSLEEAITFLEQEVIVDELLLNLLGHASERIVGTLQLSFQSGESRGDLLFHLLVHSLGQAGIERISL